MDENVLEQAVPPATFVRQVKDALEKLHDFPSLQRHPLAQAERQPAEAGGEAPGQRLQRQLLDAIEALNPTPGVSSRAPHTRLHSLLMLCYVEGATVLEAALQLGISRRQAHRDLRRAEEAVAAVLWARRGASAAPGTGADEEAAPQVEIAQLETQARPVDLRSLLQHSQAAVSRLARQRAVSFHMALPPDPVSVSTDPMVAQQILVSTLSYAVQHAQPGEMVLRLAANRSQTDLILRYRPSGAATDAPVFSGIAAQLAYRLGWTVEQAGERDSSRLITLHITAHHPTILIVDDNQGLAKLLDRYLTGCPCRLIAATSGQEALRLARDLRPQAIVLDVMMPEMDGWEVLQRLRASSHTANMPVIVCSVFNDPELAYSLGASLFLAKPVRREEVLSALRQLHVI